MWQSFSVSQQATRVSSGLIQVGFQIRNYVTKFQSWEVMSYIWVFYVKCQVLFHLHYWHIRKSCITDRAWPWQSWLDGQSAGLEAVTTNNKRLLCVSDQFIHGHLTSYNGQAGVLRPWHHCRQLGWTQNQHVYKATVRCHHQHRGLLQVCPPTLDLNPKETQGDKDGPAQQPDDGVKEPTAPALNWSWALFLR